MGEVVNYTCNAQIAIDEVIGDDTYVNGTTCDAAGSVVERVLGSNGVTTQYDYFASGLTILATLILNFVE